MQSIKYFTAFLLVTIVFLHPSLLSAWPGMVVNIADGDTITVLRGKEQVRVRLYGIDTPEKRQPFGSKAKRFTAKMAGKERVEIKSMDIDRYGRTVALVYIEGDGECLNEELIRAGYAWVYERYCRIRDCEHWQELQKKARLSGKGLWAGSNPTPPWEWRHGGKRKSRSASRDKDCSDFSTHAQAQRFFEAHGPGDPHRLDGDGDGQACEGLP